MRIYTIECDAAMIRRFIEAAIDSYERALHSHGSHQSAVEIVQDIAVQSIDRMAVYDEEADEPETVPCGTLH